MLNRGTITSVSYGNRNQILANVDFQASVSCLVDAAIGTAEGSRTIAKAGTPIHVNLEDRDNDPAVLADGETGMNAVLLHDVDVTDGNANGTALLFGFVNLNRLDEDVVTKVTAALAATDATKQITFLRG